MKKTRAVKACSGHYKRAEVRFDLVHGHDMAIYTWGKEAKK